MRGIRDSVRTISAGYDCEALKGITTRDKYTLSLMAKNVLEFDRSKSDPVWKLVSEFRGPVDRTVDADQTEVPT